MPNLPKHATEIKCGIELDRAVAGAVGLTVEEGSGTEGTKFLSVDRDEYIQLMANLGRKVLIANPMFHPSYDMNAAFAAALRVDLFRDHVLGYDAAGWNVWPAVGSFLGPASCFQPTPALAICEAILELKNAEARD